VWEDTDTPGYEDSGSVYSSVTSTDTERASTSTVNDSAMSRRNVHEYQGDPPMAGGDAEKGGNLKPADEQEIRLADVHHDLTRGLKARHITMIAIGGAIGTGLIIGT
jgi:amino acid permease